MISADIHTHSDFSSDGRAPLSAMLARAEELGLAVWGTTEHFDYDFLAAPFFVNGKPILATTDPAAYFPAARKLRMAHGDYLVGAEFGYHPARCILDAFLGIEEVYSPDYVINSVHSADGEDCFFPAYFAGKTRAAAYGRYLERVRESLDAPYRYEVVGHLGYVSRNAPYPAPRLRYEEFPDLIDDILRTIVAKGKILEANTSVRTAGSPFLPDPELFARYFELGGRKVCFGSDAHLPARIGEGRETVAERLKAIGFTRLTVPFRGGEREFPL